MERKVTTIQRFLKDFYDADTLPTAHCVVCYQQKPPADLNDCQWREIQLHSEEDRFSMEEIFSCHQCFPRSENATVLICQACETSLLECEIPKNCSINNAYISCEHCYPSELHNLSPVEEKLISLNTAYGYIARFTVDKKNCTGIHYRRRIKGHIIVFPNDVEGLTANVLPHPLLKTMENIHVSWSGADKPTPQDVSKLLKVRKSVVLAALRWLKRHNYLYRDVVITETEISKLSYMANSEVPGDLYGALQHVEPTAQERMQESTINTRDTDRMGSGETPSANCTAIVEELDRIAASKTTTDGTGADYQSESTSDIGPNGDEPTLSTEMELGYDENLTHEITSSAMLDMDHVTNPQHGATRLEFIRNALSETPYIRTSRGRDSVFADSMDPEFFPRTFPTLFPFGLGGPLGLKSVPSICRHTAELDNVGDEETTRDQTLRPLNVIRSANTSSLISDSNQCTKCQALYQPNAKMPLKTWTNLMLNRHGGRFACHPIFCFLAFNMILRHGINRISTIKMSSTNYKRAQDTFSRLSPDILHQARIELEETNRTSNQEVWKLLNELSLFFHSQPLSNESRLQMRKKIKALCVQNGLPAIWFTINPNDITNAVKLRMAVYRDAASAAEAERILNDMITSSQQRYKIQCQTMMDPVSSAIFFHREIEKFFEHYVQVGRDSVFGKISHYYAGVETNNRGALHLHGLMWLEGNIDLPMLCATMKDPEQREYGNKIIAYVDDVFTESLNSAGARIESQNRSARTMSHELVNSCSFLQENFKKEANFVAYQSQIHEHSQTCVKYSYRDLANDISKDGRTPCRFHAPWPLVEDTHFSEGLLKVVRNHGMVNRYNEAMAIGLRHNHDISMIVSKGYSLSMIYYITNYATKLESPTWKRIALAEEILRVIEAEETTYTSQPHEDNVEVTGNQVYIKTSIIQRYYTKLYILSAKLHAYGFYKN